MTLQALTTVNHSGKIYGKGSLIEKLTKKEEERLIRLRAAQRVQTVVMAEKVAQPPINPAEYEALKRDLDEAYGADELLRQAKSHKVDLAAGTKKEQVIEAIIAQGFVNEFLEDDA